MPCDDFGVLLVGVPKTSEEFRAAMRRRGEFGGLTSSNSGFSALRATANVMTGAVPDKRLSRTGPHSNRILQQQMVETR